MAYNNKTMARKVRTNLLFFNRLLKQWHNRVYYGKKELFLLFFNRLLKKWHNRVYYGKKSSRELFLPLFYCLIIMLKKTIKQLIDNL